MHRLEQFQWQSLAGVDVAGGGGAGHGLLARPHPLLDLGHGAGAGPVGAEGLAEESPEGDVVGIDATALGGAVLVDKLGRNLGAELGAESVGRLVQQPLVFASQ